MYFTECIVNEKLTGVFDVVGVVHDGWLDVLPVPSLSVEAVGLVSDTAGFETPVLQFVATPLVDVQTE